MKRLWPRLLLAAYTIFMLVITLCILGSSNTAINLMPFRSMMHDIRVGGQSFVVNFCGNFFAFMPFGFLLPLASARRIRPWHALVIVGGFSLAIETCQYLFAGRTADIDDVILDGLGGLAGYLVVRPFLGRNYLAPEIQDSSNVA